MKFNELTLLLEQNESSMFISRNLNQRKEQYLQQFNKRIYDYISSTPSFPKNHLNHLDLDGYPGEKLPAELKYVDGTLNLSNSKIKQLPPGLEINRTLTLNAVENDVYIPESVKYKSLDISMTGISSIPGNRTLNFLYMSDNWELTSLPDGLKMLDLDATVSHLTHIPKDIKVFENVYISETPFIENFINTHRLSYGMHDTTDEVIITLKHIYPGMQTAHIYYNI